MVFLMMQELKVPIWFLHPYENWIPKINNLTGYLFEISINIII